MTKQLERATLETRKRLADAWEALGAIDTANSYLRGYYDHTSHFILLRDMILKHEAPPKEEPKEEPKMAEILDWALDRAWDLAAQEPDNANAYCHAFAKYIAEHETPPVDPVAEACVKLINKAYGADRNLEYWKSHRLWPDFLAAFRENAEVKS